MADDVMVLEEAAQYLKVHPSTIYRLLKKNELPAFKVGSDWRFRRTSLERWSIEQEALYREQAQPAAEL